MTKKPQMGVVDDKGNFHPMVVLGDINSAIATATAGAVRGARYHLASRDSNGRVTKHGVFRPSSLAGNPASNQIKRGA